MYLGGVVGACVGVKVAGFSDLATGMLVSAQRRLDATAINVSNINTPGFRAKKVFQRVVDARQAMPTVSVASHRSVQAIALKTTGNPLDFAVTGGGAFLLRDGDRLIPAVAAQLRRADDGRLVDMAGRAVQGSGGGDVMVGAGAPVLLKDGALLIDGQPEARIGIFAVDDLDPTKGFFKAGIMPEEVQNASAHQGMTIPSDVDLGTEMVEITRAARMAEAGARVFQIYDDLMGRVTSKLGEAGR